MVLAECITARITAPVNANTCYTYAGAVCEDTGSWRPPVESRPTRPQLTWFDNRYTEGIAGLWFNEDAVDSYAIFRFAEASDSLFPGQCDYDLVGDVNNDCTVNLLDVAMLAANYLTDCDLDPGGPNEPPCMLK